MKLILSVGFFFLAFAPAAFCQTDSTYAFSPDVKITESGAYDGNSLYFYSTGQHYTAYRGDTVYVIWHEDRDNPYGSWILFAKSTDGGKTFGSNVYADVGWYPSMRVDSAGVIYLAYANGGDILFLKSANGGASFDPQVRVTDDTGAPAGAAAPALAVNNKGHIFVTWLDYRTDPYSVFAAASYDGGLTFTPNVQVSEPGTRGFPGDIGADESGRVYVAYHGTTGGQSGIVVARSEDSGQSFNFRVLASDTLWTAGTLSMAVVPGGLIGVAWEGTRLANNFLNYILHFLVSFDYGQTFSPSVRVDDDSDLTFNTAPFDPSLAYTNDIFYVAYMREDSPFGKQKIFFSYSLDSGKSFAPSVDVNANTTDPSNRWHDRPGLAVNEAGKTFVAWRDGRYTNQIEFIQLLFGAPGKFVRLLKGDLNLDEMLTPTDVVLEINAVFSGQSFPAPFRNADGNCSSTLTPADIVLLLNAVFLTSAFPC